jgi:RecA-family ATPase
LFTGAGSSGKSLLGQQLATCMAAGRQCLGLDVSAGSSLYITCEDDEQELHWRQAQICDALGVRMADLTGTLHLVSRRGELANDLCTFDRAGTITPTPTFHKLVRMAVATQAQVIILDNVAHLFTGNENDRGDVTRFVNLLTGAAVLLIGHPNKAGADYSGSTAWLNAVRSQVFLHHDRQTDVRTLSIGKANYARTGDAVRFLWDAGAFVREDDLPPDRAKELASTIRASADNELFLACLRERTKQQRAVSEKRGPTFAPTEFAKLAESKGIGKERLEAAMERLFRIKAIERAELPWKSRDRHLAMGLRETAANGAADTVEERG